MAACNKEERARGEVKIWSISIDLPGKKAKEEEPMSDERGKHIVEPTPLFIGVPGRHIP